MEHMIHARKTICHLISKIFSVQERTAKLRMKMKNILLRKNYFFIKI